ncbi:4'-phosphopantetheinyl transferase family protein [Pseudomarimonas salicorniae]|uniref:4'-phosphopantetheinyl transferase superfamily protein n=1 Tax=Pseudomarimonas salicorniae TaxID=2933270 RepID=A0ABT0GIX8_9GAMM|nr:4'-phosphopantetheinyl transferase superfamily protein [Lysobacter sp. CAU 1642]MCK7594506.1 4'-phosphopantetheinyl transferase superfamily protein [Lysobacter sp. CAU 1642]
MIDDQARLGEAAPGSGTLAAMSLPPPTELAWPPPALQRPRDEETDLWWIDPVIAAELPTRARARHLLHSVLAVYLDGEPLALDREPKGRPFLRNPSPPDFNLSDTRGGTVLAVAGRGRIGIDLERLDRDPPVARLASRWFSAEEAEAIAGLDGEAARSAFLRLWTAKEAACKATGTGIFGWLPQWRFEVGPEAPCARSAPGHAGSLSDWHFLRVAPSDQHTCVLAVWGFQPRWRHFFRVMPG